MKRVALSILTISIFFAFTGMSQSRAISDGSYRSISIYDWDDEDKFKTGPLPYLQGHGILSDSLSRAYNGIQFYELNGEYYAIRSWADYYYWFTKRHPELFSVSILEYEYYWLIGDEIGMVRFISSCENYSLGFLPSPFTVQFAGLDIEAYGFDECNRLNIAYSDPGSWEQGHEKFHRSLKNKVNGEPANNQVSSTALTGDLDQMRNYVRENRMKKLGSSVIPAGGSRPSRSIQSSSVKN